MTEIFAKYGRIDDSNESKLMNGTRKDSHIMESDSGEILTSNFWKQANHRLYKGSFPERPTLFNALRRSLGLEFEARSARRVLLVT